MPKVKHIDIESSRKICAIFRRKKSMERDPEFMGVLKLMGQYFKTTFINVFKDVKENMDIMCQQERNQGKWKP